MFFFTYKKIRSIVSAFLLIIIIASSFAFVPISHQGQIQHAEARIVFDPKNTGANLHNSVINTITSIAEDAFYIKEFTLDGIASGLAKLMLKSMTQSILNWINSGFQGSPAFVTDLKQFMLDRADQVVGDFIYNDPSLNFLCSPFQLDVKIALATTYKKEKHDGFASQCTLSGVTDNVEGFLSGSFNDGGWASWFEITQNTINTPTGAYLAAKGEMYARIADDKGNTVKELEWGKGFLSFKVCSDAQKASGNVKNCNITTPGAVIADQIKKSLGAGQDSLIAADEINEIIGALFAQLAKKAITGISGLLGLGGGSQYSDNSYGSSGSSSYLDALGSEGTETSTLANPFTDAINKQQKNTSLQKGIISSVTALESKLSAAQASVLNCSALNRLGVSSQLLTAKQDAQTKVLVSSSSISILSNLSRQYEDTQDSNEKLRIVNIYQQMQADGTLISPVANANTKFYIDFELQDQITAFNTTLSTTVNNCRHEVDGGNGNGGGGGNGGDPGP